MYSRPQTQRPYTAPARPTPVAGGGGRFPYTLFFIAYAAFAIYFYVFVIEPYLAAFDLFATRILADTITYETICVVGTYYLDWTTLRDVGPCVALRLTSFHSGWLSIANAAIMVVSALWLARAYDRHWKPVLTLILVNPITFLSIFGANKEVFGLIAFVMLAIFIRNRSPAALALCLVTALFTRIPIMIVVATYCLMLVTILPRDGALGPTAVRRYVLLMIAMTVAVSLIAAIFGETLQYSLLGDLAQADVINRGLELSLSLDYLSGYGLYAVNCVIRLVLNLYSGMFGFVTLLGGGAADYYSVGVAGSSALFVVLSAVTLAGRRAGDLRGNARLWNIIVFVTLLSLILCVSPVIQHRYFYPLFVFLILLVTKPRHETPGFAVAHGGYAALSTSLGSARPGRGRAP